jgi:hypothetical protein
MCPVTDAVETPTQLAAVDRSRWLRWAPTVAGILGTTVLVALLARPALAGPWRPQDWYEHAWYVWHQESSIRANGFPSLFVHNTSAVFNPHYAFYGGTLYALAGALALVLGSAKAAFAVFWIAAVVSACGGWYWLARMAGVGPWMANIPGVLFITSPYYLNMIYGTGAWAELIAVSTIPLLVASAVSILRDDRLRLWPALAFAATAVLFAGSHNITLLWGSTVLLIVSGAILIVAPSARQIVTRRGAVRVLGLLVPALLMNAWFLLPDIAYQSMTLVASIPASANLRAAAPLVESRHLFSLERSALPPRFFVLALPVVAMAWVAAGMVVARLNWRTTWYRVVLVLVGAIAGLTVLMTNVSLILALPEPFPALQFGYRLEAYILLCLSAAAIGLLRLVSQAERGRAIWQLAAIPVVLLAVVQAMGQTRPNHVPSYIAGDAKDVRPYHTDLPWVSELDYASARPPLSPVPRLDAMLAFSPSAERGDHASVTVGAVPGDRVPTNFAGMPELVRVDGARIVGRHVSGRAVMQIAQDATPGAATVTIRAASPWPVALGRVLSVLGLLGLLANGVALVLARRRRPR